MTFAKSKRRLFLLAALLLTSALAFAQEKTKEPPKTEQPKKSQWWLDPSYTQRKQVMAERKPEKVPAYKPPEDTGDRGQYDGYGRSTNGAVRLLRAARLRQQQTPKGEVIFLERDVKIIQDSLTIWCNEARHYRQEGRLDLTGDVIMMDPKQRLDADRVTYYEESRQSEARGHVRIERDSLILTSSTATYDVKNKRVLFINPFVSRDLRRDVLIRGRRGVYDTEHERGEIPVEPVLIHYDSLGVEDARVEAERMEFDKIEGVAVARDSVRIVWNDVMGRSQELWFWPDSARALMVTDPRIWRERDEAVGDTIWLYVTGEVLDSTVVRGNAIAYTPSDSTETSPRSTLQGRRIVMDFVDGKVNRMQADREAIGVYHVFEKGVDRGSNKVSGDRVILWMSDTGELSDVVVEGGTEGKFLPPRLAKELRKDDRTTK